MATKRIGKGDKLNGATSVQEMVGPGSKVDSESKKRSKYSTHLNLYMPYKCFI